MLRAIKLALALPIELNLKLIDQLGYMEAGGGEFCAQATPWPSGSAHTGACSPATCQTHACTLDPPGNSRC